MKYLIELVADPKGLEPAITAIDELNAKEKELKATTTTVSAEQKKMLDAYAEKAKLGKASIDKMVDGYKQLGKAATGAFGGEAIKGATKAAESFRTQLRGSREEITKLFVSGKATTAQIYEMSKGAGELKDSIGDAQQAISVLSSDTFTTDAILGGLQGVAGGVQAVVGASVLFTGVQAVAAEVTAKLNALMAISNGIKEVQIALQEVSAARLGAEILAQKAYALVVGQSTGALATFRLVLASVTGVAIIAGLVALVANWSKIKNAINGTNEELEKWKDLRKEASESIGSEIGDLIRLKTIILDQSLSYKTRNDALIELKKIAPEYTSSIKSIGVAESELDDVIRKQIDLLVKREEVRILSARIAEREINRQTETEVTALQKLDQAMIFAMSSFSGSWQDRLEAQRKYNRKLYDNQTEADKLMLEQLVKSLGERNIEKEEKTTKAEKKINDEVEDLYRKSLIARRQLEAEQEKLFQQEKQKRNDERLKSLRAQLEKEEDLYRKSLKNRRDLEAQQQRNIDEFNKEQSQIRFKTRRAEIQAEIDLELEKQQAISDAAIQIAQQTSDAIFQIVNSSRNAEFNAEIQRLNELKDREIKDKDLTDAQKARIEERYQRKIAEIKTKQARADKAAAIAQAIINGALAITKIFTSVTALNPAAYAAIAVTAASTAAQIAVISAQKIPKFAKGTEYVKGGGTETSDSVPAMLSKGERVIDAKTNKLLKGIPNKLIPDLLIPRATMIKEGMDYDKLAKAFSKELANNPALMVNFDKQGFTTFIKSGVTTSQIKNNRNGV